MVAADLFTPKLSWRWLSEQPIPAYMVVPPVNTTLPSRLSANRQGLRTDIDMALHNGLACDVMDAVYLLVNDAGLEADLRATAALASDVLLLPSGSFPAYVAVPQDNKALQ